ncbi:ssDNA binding protein-like protein [Mytilinidion resinicola]|uniref:SsDNA binding protein-like protein n=1 Tax=Mytilinidion resinicola TaxID=574789 RepID=A0A6A6YSW7_9PEZI|nr:ssDNA binding protein-like protein [Mytilinidion resinicola]KAF2811055.1 ssDNA binding protein-like protein [Mytilinidion resinicola]
MLAATFRTARASGASAALSTRAFSSTVLASSASMSISGRLGAAPEEQSTASTSIVKYLVATSYGKTENRKTSWFRVSAFTDGAQKEFLLSLPKGALVHVNADARMEQYTDKDGNPRTSLNLVQRSIDVLSRPRPQIEENEEGLVREASG